LNQNPLVPPSSAFCFTVDLLRVYAVSNMIIKQFADEAHPGSPDMTVLHFVWPRRPARICRPMCFYWRSAKSTCAQVCLASDCRLCAAWCISWLMR